MREHILADTFCGDCIHFESIHPCFDDGQGGMCQIAKTEEDIFVVTYDFGCKDFVDRDTDCDEKN